MDRTKSPGYIVLKSDGEFGWNLEGWTKSDIMERRELLAQSDVFRIKIPTWLPSDMTKDQRRQLNEFCDEWLAGEFAWSAC